MPELPSIRPERIPAEVRTLCRVLNEAGHGAWVVGGCLRDLLRGAQASDWDLATAARPDQVQALFRRVIPTGIQHGTVTVRLGGQGFEVTTLRGEGAYTDGRRPDHVQFVQDVREDLARRDFTINAMAFDPIQSRLEDPFGGVEDLRNKLIRAVGEPEARFSEDGLRVLRAARFAATLEFALDPATEAAIRPTLATFRKVSAERVREEWNKALAARQPSRAFEIMSRTGILAECCSLLDEGERGVQAARMRAVDQAPNERVLRLASLFYPDSASDVEAWLGRYRYANRERQRVGHLLAQLPDAACLAAAPDGELRRWASRVGRDEIQAALALNATVAVAHFGGDSEQARAASRLRERMPAALQGEVALSTRELALSGNDLIRELGVPPGKQIGRILTTLLARVIDQPELNRPERLYELVRDMNSERGA